MKIKKSRNYFSIANKWTKEFSSRLKKSHFLKTVVDSYILRFLQALVGLGSSILVARLLGPEGQGKYAAAIVLGSLGTQFANLGIHWSNNYYVAQERRLLPSLMANSLWVGLGIGGVLAAILAVLFKSWPQAAPVGGAALVLALVWIPISLTYLLFQFLLVGLHQTVADNRIELTGRILKVLLMLGLWAVGWVTVDSFFGAAFISLGAVFLLNYRVLSGYLLKPLRASWGLFQSHMAYGLRAYLSAFFAFLVLRVDQLMVQYQAGSTQTGYYATAVNMGDAVCSLPSVISVVLFPKLSAMGSTGEKWRMTQKVLGMTAAGFIPLFLLAGAVAGPVLGFLFGDRYQYSVIPFLWLLPGLYFLSLQWVASRFLHSIGFPKRLIASWGITALLNIGLNFWAIPRWGIIGASAVSSITYFVIMVLTLTSIRQLVRSRT